MGTWLANHSSDIVLAVLFAVAVDLMSIGSRLRSLISIMKNKNAERSAKSLRKRIAKLEEYRNTFVSEKAMYLACFRYVLGVLMFLALGGIVLVFVHSDIAPSAPYKTARTMDVLAFLSLVLAVICGVMGMDYASSDTREKVAMQVAKIDVDIRKLELRLARIKG